MRLDREGVKNMKLFYGLEATSTDRKMGYCENVIISAASSYAMGHGKLRQLQPPIHQRLFIDSGGFSFFSKYDEYPFDTRTYVDYCKGYDPFLVAVRDYPCEPGISRNLRGSNIERIDATIENTKECLAIDEVPWISVVQGYSPDEYLYCCQRIKDEGLETEHLAIGTLCCRKKVAEARKVIELVHRQFPNAKLHGFGIDLRFLKDPRIRTALWSSDTQAWKWNGPETMQKDSGYFKPSCQAIKLENYRTYSAKVDKVLSRDEGQSSLKTFGGRS